jgi:hypothetical protein
MTAEGKVIGHAPDRAEKMRQDISKRLSAGPPSLTPAALNALRYEITDAVDDLRGEGSSSETMAIGAMLPPKLVDLALRGQGGGRANGRPRLLRVMDTSLANRFEDAFRMLFVSGNPDLVIALAEAELDPHGGPLFEGDCRSPLHRGVGKRQLPTD